MKHQWIAKLALLIAWPPLALLLFALMSFVLVMFWFLIPFGVLKRNDNGSGYTMTGPWAD